MFFLNCFTLDVNAITNNDILSLLDTGMGWCQDSGLALLLGAIAVMVSASACWHFFNPYYII